MIRLLRWVPTVAAWAASLLCVLDAPAQTQRFRSQAVAVRVDVLVTEDKRLVTGLTAADFELRDAGVLQDVKQIDVEQLPLNVVLTVDTSQSVEGTRLTSLLHAARGLVGGLREPDRAALLSFSTRVHLLSALTSSRPQITAALRELSASGATSLRDAVFSALALRQDDPGRTLVLVFSDGNDTSSWLSTSKVMEAARRTDAVVYGIGIRQQGRFVGIIRTETIEEIGELLRKVTEETGGRVLFASTDADLRTTFERTLDEFRNRYVLSYTPTGVPATGWHTLDVKLTSKKGKVTARRGYFVDLPAAR